MDELFAIYGPGTMLYVTSDGNNNVPLSPTANCHTGTSAGSTWPPPAGTWQRNVLNKAIANGVILFPRWWGNVQKKGELVLDVETGKMVPQDDMELFWERMADTTQGQWLNMCDTCTTPGGPSEIPTLTEWGMIILALVMLSSMTYVIVRQRRRGQLQAY
jgi:hypothetical protein